MECNKEEAVRAMDIAKRKVTENDYNGAKKFAEKAQNLYPKLEGLKQVSMMIDVYIVAGNKISGGESDWYGILGVDPLADDEVVKKQYKKLALLLHPDKNKCKGAEEAFKLVSEAWCLLSDKVKRIAYDQKRKSKQVKPRKSRKPKQPPNQPPNQRKQPPNQRKQPPNQQQQPPNQQQQQPSQPKQPPNQQKQPPSQPKQPPNQQKQPSNQPSSSGVRNDRSRSKKPTSKVGTFWTMCDKCKTPYEYVRVFYFNKTLICRTCHQTFIATEKEQTPTEKEKTPEATNKKANSASSCGRDPSLTVNVGYSFQWDCSTSRMVDSDCGNVANQAEERAERGVEGSQEDAAKGIANSDFKVEERVLKKLRTDDYAEASGGIKV
ncbi:unnamed protein product [Arabis nemorensis]|uniref:J domain-containing protein n=1 Tax=Arabis nemorensis TaxID=586526 RepID=A0A565CFL8_9BRAS|nr:unnamed protein product [Arabis nemorensis]